MCTVDIDWLCYIYIYILYILYIYYIYTTCIFTSLYLFAITECMSHRLQSLGRKVWYNTIPFLPAGEVPQSCLPALHNISTCEKTNNANRKMTTMKTLVSWKITKPLSLTSRRSKTHTLSLHTPNKHRKKYRTRPPWLAWKRMPSGHRGQLAAACPEPRKMVPFWTFLEAVWSTLKQFEALWNS